MQYPNRPPRPPPNRSTAASVLESLNIEALWGQSHPTGGNQTSLAANSEASDSSGKDTRRGKRSSNIEMMCDNCMLIKNKSNAVILKEAVVESLCHSGNNSGVNSGRNSSKSSSKEDKNISSTQLWIKSQAGAVTTRTTAGDSSLINNGSAGSVDLGLLKNVCVGKWKRNANGDGVVIELSDQIPKGKTLEVSPAKPATPSPVIDPNSQSDDTKCEVILNGEYLLTEQSKLQTDTSSSSSSSPSSNSRYRFIAGVLVRSVGTQVGHLCTWKNCNKLFPERFKMERHMLSHTGEKPHQCQFPDCGKEFSRQDRLAQHEIQAHSDIRNYVCEHEGCGKGFKRPDHLRKHLQIHEEEKWKCEEPFCFRILPSYSDLLLHYKNEHKKTRSSSRRMQKRLRNDGPVSPRKKR
eukprot:Nk52_evm31s266 gene=Nk52_evmTU31s266